MGEFCYGNEGTPIHIRGDLCTDKYSHHADCAYNPALPYEEWVRRSYTREWNRHFGILAEVAHLVAAKSYIGCLAP